MPQFLADYIITYGYLAIFCLILLQELGMPGLPNELMLLYFGYAGHKAGLSYIIVAGLSVLADMTGSFLLFLLFFYGKNFLSKIKPRWLPLPLKKIGSLRQKITAQKGRNIFIAKLTPFVRSYLPVAAGLLQVEPVLYGRIILLTAFIWSGGWVTAGWLLHF